MPQFDFSTLSVTLFSSIFSALVYYLYFGVRLLPEVILFFKFRHKKIYKTNTVGLESVFLPKLQAYLSIAKVGK